MAKKPASTQQSYTPDAERFRRARNRLGMSGPAFAEACGVSKGTIQNIENGEKITGAMLIKIAERVADTHVGQELGCTHWHDLLHDDERKLLGPALAPPPALPVTAPSLANRLFQLPAALTDFVGRMEDKEKIVARLSGGEKVGLWTAFRGMGGIGKTSFAVVVAHAVKHLYPDAQLFLELRGVSDLPMTAVDAMSRIIRDFHPETGKLPDTVEELQPLYLSVLSGKRALVVLDNAKDESQVKPPLAAGPPVAFLITSRNALRLDNVECVRLDMLPPVDALALLRKIVGEKGTDDELNEVAELCGRLPLALRVAGSYLQTYEDCEVAEYVRDLKSFGLEQLQKGVTDKDQDVELVLSHSARALVRDNPERAARWQMLSVFPANFSPSATMGIWELDEQIAMDELRSLSVRSLVEYDGPTQRYSLHELLRPVAGEAFAFVPNHPLHAGAADRLLAADRRFAGHYAAVLAVADKLYLQGHENVLRALALFDLEVGNIRHAQAWAAKQFATERYSAFAADMCVRYALAGVEASVLRLSVRERIRWLEMAVDAAQQLEKKDWVGMALGNLGNAHCDLGDARTAIGYFEAYLAIVRDTGDRRGEGNALGNLGNVHADLGEARTAITYYEQVLAIARDIGDRRGEGTALGNLGAAHYDLGDAQTALAYFEQDLAITREMGDRRGEGKALGNLGNAHAALGDARTAIGYHEQNLAIARDTGDRRGEGYAYWNMALALNSLGRRADAISHAAHALAIRETIEDPNAEKVRHKLAEWRAESGKAPPDGSA